RAGISEEANAHRRYRLPEEAGAHRRDRFVKRASLEGGDRLVEAALHVTGSADLLRARITARVGNGRHRAVVRHHRRRSAAASTAHLEDIVPRRLERGRSRAEKPEDATDRGYPEGSHGTISFPWTGLEEFCLSLLQHRTGAYH